MRQYHRTDYLDQYAEQGELAVMLRNGQVVAVSLVAARVLEVLDQHGSLEALQIRHILEADARVPNPPKGEVSVLGLLGSLEGAGLLGLPEPDPELR